MIASPFRQRTEERSPDVESSATRAMWVFCGAHIVGRKGLYNLTTPAAIEAKIRELTIQFNLAHDAHWTAGKNLAVTLTVYRAQDFL